MRTSLYKLFFAIFLIFSVPAFADIFRFVDTDGRVVYTDCAMGNNYHLVIKSKDLDNVKKRLKRAESGNAEAQYELGCSITDDNEQSLMWFMKAAEQGLSRAQYALGQMYFHTQGAQDYNEAVKWYRLAAKQGHASGQANLGYMYYSGQGVSQDYVRALMWSDIGARNGNAYAVKNQGIFAKQMSPQQVTEAQAMVKTCLTSNYKNCGDNAFSGANKMRFTDLIEQTAYRHQIDAKLLDAIIQTGSGYNPKATSSNGAVGLMQLMPDIAKRFGVTDVYDPDQNVDGGSRYLKYLINLYPYLDLALAAYHAGEDEVIRYKNSIPPFPETRNYVKNVMALYNGMPRFDELGRALVNADKAGDVKAARVLAKAYQDLQAKGQSISATTPRINSQTTGLSSQGVSTTTKQTQSPAQLDPGKALFDVFKLVVFGFIIFYILTFGLIGKKRDSATKRGRWYGSIAVLLFLCSGGAKYNVLWSEEWLAATLVLSVAWFVIGYLIGIAKGCLSNRKKQGAKEPPPFEYTKDEHFDHKNTSQESSEENHKSEAKTKKEHSYEERLNALRSNIAKCFAILDLDIDASPSEIKAAFKKKMSSYHPDKVSGLGDKLKQVAEEESRLLNIAYQTLKNHGYC